MKQIFQLRKLEKGIHLRSRLMLLAYDVGKICSNAGTQLFIFSSQNRFFLFQRTVGGPDGCFTIFLIVIIIIIFYSGAALNFHRLRNMCWVLRGTYQVAHMSTF